MYICTNGADNRRKYTNETSYLTTPYSLSYFQLGVKLFITFYMCSMSVPLVVFHRTNNSQLNFGNTLYVNFWQ